MANSVYRRSRVALLCGVLALGSGWLALPQPVQAQGLESTVLDARDALRRKDAPRLAAARAQAAAEQNPLAMWVDYWELTNRIATAQQDELDAFDARWPATYVEDRLRNDWLLELGKRRDWANFAVVYPRFRMNDDREVNCYALLVDSLAGKPVRDAALAAWLAQRDADDGCALLATSLYAANQFNAADLWRKARFAIDASRPRAARQALALLGPGVAKSFDQLIDNPARYLARGASTDDRNGAELTTLALARIAATDPDAAAFQLGDRWERRLPADLAAWSWATIAKQSALKLQPQAADHFLRASLAATRARRDLDWPDETLAWKARSALRADDGKPRWQQVMQAINAMSPAEQREASWVYWKARAMQALAPASQDGSTLRATALQLMQGIAGEMSFYGMLAAENAGQPLALPPHPPPLSAAERAAALANPGLNRALQLIAIGLRNEGVREWNYSLRGLGERELLAAAQLACDREVWDRCINTSERTQTEIDMEQRFPTPFRSEVSNQSRAIGLDPAYVFGLIRQESRFIIDARSGAGASGLMQLMPATARWTAKKIGLAYSPALISDRDTNLALGTGYLKLVLDDFGGSQALAAAAYNAGPGRPRRWREGPVIETAIWAENIPFHETRDYVKKVLSNATYYAALLGRQPPSLRARLGRFIGPASSAELSAEKELP